MLVVGIHCDAIMIVVVEIHFGLCTVPRKWIVFLAIQTTDLR